MSKLLVVLLSLSFLTSSQDLFAVSSKTRNLSFNYQFDVPASDAKNLVDVFVPLAVDDKHQKIKSQTFYLAGKKVDPSKVGELGKDSVYGNRFWHLKIKQTKKPIVVAVKYEIERSRHKQENLAKVRKTFFTKKEAKEFALFLKANKRVPIKGKMISSIIKELKIKDGQPLPVAKKIYDYVVDNMEYKKVGTGWGNGDTFWACSEKYGNCTDFHALFTSLARSQGIPSRFEIGFPIPEDRKEGALGGYHCWINFNLPNVGWVPIDASEAKKHPEKREMFFGTHPTDRIKFTVGRDIKLGKGHKSRALNYFIFPHLEVSGKKLKKVATKFSYKDI